MVKSSVSSESLRDVTQKEKRWPYDEFYMGNTDDDNRRNGQGENHWTGAESIEWHVGDYFRDTMHGYGDYRWRYKDRDRIFATYEGRFFANQLHGYGVMSYPDGRVFTGLFYKDLRWGPGEERIAALQSNVGLWRGTQLARLCWRPPTYSVIPDLSTGPSGAAFLQPFRIMLQKNVIIPGQTNSALDLLKQHGADPIQASKMWPKLYPTHCTDLNSVLCHKDTFLNEYYKGKICSLHEAIPGVVDDISRETIEEPTEITKFFAWNNNETMVHMMKHSFQHDDQRKSQLNIEHVLSGPRKLSRPAAKHENDCRTTLMASYLGHISMVAQLINEEDVYADIADMQGNTALMYATRGNQCDIIHFLVEAGANVDSWNDSCCTPLGVALMTYLCIVKDLKPIAMVVSLLPPVANKADKASPHTEIQATEWWIKRELPLEIKALFKPLSTKNLHAPSKATKSQLSNTAILKKTALKIQQSPDREKEYYSDDDIFNEDKRQFCAVKEEYVTTVMDLFELKQGPTKNAPYLFEVYNMMKDVEMEIAIDHAKAAEKHSKKPGAKVSKEKEMTKSRDVFPDHSTMGNLDAVKVETLSKIHSTILQLLLHGANPKLVKCPQPGLLMAVKSGSLELVKELIVHGADVNEKNSEMLNYTVLDVVLSGEFNNETVDMVRVLLESGADVNHRLSLADVTADLSDEPGPTLLHVLLSKKLEFEFLEEIRNHIIELFLQYNANPCAIFCGKSPVDMAMNKSIVLMEVFINNPGTDLNAIINSNNETILVKIFTREYFKMTAGMNRFPILTNLLLRGADPLIECYYGDTKFGNIFEFARGILATMLPQAKQSSPQAAEAAKAKKTEKEQDKKKEKGKDSKEKPGKGNSRHSNSNIVMRKNDESVEYSEALDLITECARLLYIRWLQAKLVKELVDVIHKYKHRTWNMILKEHVNGNNVGLWVTTQRCLEIWDILKTTKKKRYNDEQILKHLLCIVKYYQKRLKDQLLITPHMTAPEKNLIESDVQGLLKEYRTASKLATDIEVWKKIYVKPELVSKNDKKFKVCFECSLPLPQQGVIICEMCQLVSFCCLECLHENVLRAACHPCSTFLLEKYFPPTPEASEQETRVTLL